MSAQDRPAAARSDFVTPDGGQRTTLRILCAYVQDGLRPETEAALKAYAADMVDFHAIRLDDEQAYPRLIAERWKKGGDFAVVEQDVVIRRDVVVAFESCANPYCAFPYAWTTNIGPALGCTRFRAELLEAFPSAAQEALGVGWRQYDVMLMRRILAQKYGMQPCVHLPPVEHLNETKQLLPGADPAPLMYVPEDIGNLR